MSLSATERQRKRRTALRERHLRPVQLWLPDTRDPQVESRIRAQCAALASDPHEGEILDWIEAASDSEGWE
ncbi:MAG: antitoxin MazE family protein [Propionibacteriaceae bacterium]|jgi:hypothetical protein|nr:antitoxin MazE family protein [Propionibacteriaceae bacterium]